MDHFQRRGAILFAEDVSLVDLAARFGTPTYVYSRATLERHVGVLRQAFAALPHHLCYAIKANGSVGLLQVLDRAGCDFDAVSVGELALALKAGVPASRVILSGVGKRDDEIDAALSLGVRYLSAESAAEVEAIAGVATHRATSAAVSLRVNPNVDARTHPHITTGRADNKFGVSEGELSAIVSRFAAHPHLRLVGLSCHIGSQITELSPFVEAAAAMRRLVEQLRPALPHLAYVGLGGGLGIPYQDETPPTPADYGTAVAKTLGDTGLRLILEPGRVIVGNAGVLLSRVVRDKRTDHRRFVLIDAGMNDLLRPALYDARHAIVPVGADAPTANTADIVGPVCESSDVFARDQNLAVGTGDLIAIRSAGAYGMSMASTYNGRPLPAEVLVDGSRLLPLRQRGELADLWQHSLDLDGRPIDGALPEGLAP